MVDKAQGVSGGPRVDPTVGVEGAGETSKAAADDAGGAPAETRDFAQGKALFASKRQDGDAIQRGLEEKLREREAAKADRLDAKAAKLEEKATKAESKGKDAKADRLQDRAQEKAAKADAVRPKKAEEKPPSSAPAQAPKAAEAEEPGSAIAKLDREIVTALDTLANKGASREEKIRAMDTIDRLAAEGGPKFATLFRISLDERRDKIDPALRDRLDKIADAAGPDVVEEAKQEVAAHNERKTAEAAGKAARGDPLSADEKKLLDAGTKKIAVKADVRKDPVAFVKQYEDAMRNGNAASKKAAYEAMRQAIRDFPQAVKEGMQKHPIPTLLPEDLKENLG